MNKPDPRTFHVKSFGCQMNVYDGDRMAELLEAEGMAPADADAADLIVLNTCHIREKAAEKVYSDIGRIAKRARGSRAPMIAVAGCVAQAEGAEIPRRAPQVDIVVGPQAYHNLPALVRAAARGERALDTGMPLLSKFGALPARRRQGPSAFLTVQEGCDKFCTYCVVPYTRGAEISRPFAAIVDEAKMLVDAGAKEVTLLGQNVNAWREDGLGLDDLIRALDAQPSRRHDRRPDPRPCRGREADALSAPARAVGLGSHPQGDEPQPRCGLLSANHRARPRRPPGHRHFRRFHCRLSRRERRRLRSDAEHRQGGELCAGFLVQILSPARNPGRGHGGSDSHPFDG